MTIQDLTRLFDYMYWANCQMWNCVTALDEHQLNTPLEYSIGSVRAQLTHMVSIENLWINYLWHEEVEFLPADYFRDLPQIREEWDALEEEIRDYLSTLTDDDLQQEIEPDFFDLPPLKLGDILLQLINHATDHRAQILAGIHRLGGDTVAQDYLRYLAQNNISQQVA